MIQMRNEERTLFWELNNVEQGIIEVNASGILDSKSSRLQHEEALDYAKRLNSFLFLLDYRDIRADATLLRVYELPVIYHELGVPRRSKIAIVLPQVKSAEEDYEFYETVCYNRGYEVRLFEEKKHALDWLRLQKNNYRL